MKYIAFLYKDEDLGLDNQDEGYNLTIPDVKGCITCGDSFIETVELGKEALSLALEDVAVLPKANNLKYFTPKILNKFDIPKNAIPQVIEYEKQEKKRITVNFTVSALKEIDDYLKSNGLKNRSAFLENAGLKAISY